MARKKRKTPGINGSSMADISFMLLIFFLITTSMETDKGLKRTLPPLAPKQQDNKPIEIRKRNIMRLLVNQDDVIVISKEINGVDQVNEVPLEQLKDMAVEFIMNPEDRPDLPEKEMREISGLGQQNVTTSTYAISLKNQIGTSYQRYIDVQNELIRAYKEVWDRYAQQMFHKKYDELSVSQQKAVAKDAYPMHISEMPLSNLTNQ